MLNFAGILLRVFEKLDVAFQLLNQCNQLKDGLWIGGCNEGGVSVSGLIPNRTLRTVWAFQRTRPIWPRWDC